MHHHLVNHSNLSKQATAFTKTECCLNACEAVTFTFRFCIAPHTAWQALNTAGTENPLSSLACAICEG